MLYNYTVKNKNASWIKAWIQTFGWVIVAGVLLYLSLRNVDLTKVWLTLSRANGWYLGLAILSVAINTGSKVIRWQVMLSTSDRRVGMGKALIALLIGQTLNWYVPGRVGDLGRVYLIGNYGARRSFALGTVALEKILDLLCYVLIFLLTLLLFPLPAIVNDSVYTLSAVTLILIVTVFLLAHYPSEIIAQLKRLIVFLPRRIQTAITPRLESGMQSLLIVRSRPELSRLAFWSAVVWGTAILTNHLAALAIGIHLPVLASMVVLVMLQAGVSVPTVPGRIGIFQYLCILALGLFNIDAGSGLSYGILLQAIIFVPTTLLSLIFISSIGFDRVRGAGSVTADIE